MGTALRNDANDVKQSSSEILRWNLLVLNILGEIVRIVVVVVENYATKY